MNKKKTMSNTHAHTLVRAAHRMLQIHEKTSFAGSHCVVSVASGGFIKRIPNITSNRTRLIERTRQPTKNIQNEK